MVRLLILFIFAVAAVPATAQESVYTKLNLDKDCVFHSEYEQGASAYCSGYKGYPVLFDEGDLRQMVRYGHVAKLDGQWESFSAFNRINDTIEWRVEDKKPYATILRWFVENVDQDGSVSKALEGQILVVSTVATHDVPRSCVVGYVDARANSNANDLARQLADTKAKTFFCGKDRATFVGKRGKFASDPVSYSE